jgi:hypothetical protein
MRLGWVRLVRVECFFVGRVGWNSSAIDNATHPCLWITRWSMHPAR